MSTVATASKTSKAKSGSKTSKAKVQKAQKAPAPAPDSPEAIKAKEKEIYEKYGPSGTKQIHKLVRGSLQWDPKRNKYTVEFQCAYSGCKEVRRVATSDLFQVTMCEPHTKEMRNKARAEKRLANKPAKATKAAKPAKAKKSSKASSKKKSDSK